MLEIPIIKPLKLKEYNTKQSKYPMAGKLPTRALFCGPSGSGKGILLSSMILDIYRDCFGRLFLDPVLAYVFTTLENLLTHILNEI